MNKSPKPRNRSAQDTTLINFRALKKQVKALEEKLLQKIEARLRKLER